MKLFLTLLAIASLVVGCASSDLPMNPSFPLTAQQGWDEVHAMEASPKALRRPVVVMGGYVDPGSAPEQTRQFIEACTGDERTIVINLTFDLTFDIARDHLIRAIEERFPSDDPTQTVEVDIVAHSMGGLIVRYAALESSDPGVKRVNIKRLFSISVPHRGTAVADLPSPDSRLHAMRRGSLMLQRLDAALDDLGYEIIPYVRLGDTMVGESTAAPWGQEAWWVQNYLSDSPHFNSSNDPRILADVLRRLRYEEPYTTMPPAPLPGPHDR